MSPYVGSLEEEHRRSRVAFQSWRENTHGSQTMTVVFRSVKDDNQTTDSLVQDHTLRCIYSDQMFLFSLQIFFTPQTSPSTDGFSLRFPNKLNRILQCVFRRQLLVHRHVNLLLTVEPRLFFKKHQTNRCASSHLHLTQQSVSNVAFSLFPNHMLSRFVSSWAAKCL